MTYHIWNSAAGTDYLNNCPYFFIFKKSEKVFRVRNDLGSYNFEKFILRCPSQVKSSHLFVPTIITEQLQNNSINNDSAYPFPLVEDFRSGWCPFPWWLLFIRRTVLGHLVIPGRNLCEVSAEEFDSAVNSMLPSVSLVLRVDACEFRLVGVAVKG